jgi:hypothetical protein
MNLSYPARALAGLALALVAVPAALAAPANFAPGQVTRVEKIERRVYVGPCSVRPNALHFVAEFSLGRWLLRDAHKDCVHATQGQRLTVQLDSGEVVSLDQVGLARVRVGDRVWFDDSAATAQQIQPLTP